MKIKNAIITKTTGKDLFQVLAVEFRKHFSYDRFSTNLYDDVTRSLSYFAAADGINPAGISTTESRPLAMGSISRMVVRSRKPIIIKDLHHYSDFSSVKSMVEYGLDTTMAFPLLIRQKILGTIYFSFKSAPDLMDKLEDILTDVSKQTAIAVDNMLSYSHLKQLNSNLIQQKQYLPANADDRYQLDGFFYASPLMVEILNLVKRVANTEVSVLLTGERDTGKDYIAKYIHNLSQCKNHLFVKTSCPALASTLFESELFGHSKGAFTGGMTSEWDVLNWPMVGRSFGTRWVNCLPNCRLNYFMFCRTVDSNEWKTVVL